MAYSPRSLTELSASIRGAFRQYLPGTDATIRQNVLYVVAKVLALLAREYELRIEHLYKQLFLSTADDVDMVRMHAADYRIYQKAASAGGGMISGTGAASTVYPAGVRLLSGGVAYVTTAPFSTNAVGFFTASVKAESTGAATNREAGALMQIADPSLYPTLTGDITVTSAGLGGGADIEDIEQLRRRALARKATPPQGGALSDYERFALDVPGVVNAWAAQFANGIGSVGVWFLFEGRPSGIPTQADLAVVDAAINARRLIRGRFYALAPVPSPVNITIALMPDSVASRAAVTAALTAFFDATRPGTRIRPGLPDAPFVLSEAWISEVISTTTGESNHVLIEPSVTSQFDPGTMPVIGTITWV